MRLLSFGWKLLVSSLLNTIYMEMRTLFIGKIYTAETLGFFNRGRQFPQLIVGNIDGSIQAVMFPALSSYQHDVPRMRSLMRRSIVTSSFLVFPLMAGLAVTAEPLVRVLLTERWLPAVPFLQIFCATYALQPIHTANLQAINALGRSEIFLKLEVLKKILGVGILLISLPYGVIAIAWGTLLSGILSSFINAFPNRQLLSYRYEEQVRDILPSLGLALVMSAAVALLPRLGLTPLPTLILQVFTGVVVYVGLAALLRLECFFYVLQLIRTRGREEDPLPPKSGI
jgi:O-antigen/teichoic acid export membrane protein